MEIEQFLQELGSKIETNSAILMKFIKSDNRETKVINRVPQIIVNGTKKEGSLNAFDFTAGTTVLRLINDSDLIDSVTLLADEANTAAIKIGLGTDDSINTIVPTFPLSAGSSITLRDVIPANIFVSSSSANQTLHVIYSGVI